MEECELTLKDLQKIQESFNRILNAIFHQRIDYPASTSTESPLKRNDEDLDSKSAKTYPLRFKKNKKGGPKDIGRVGVLEAELSLLFVNDRQIQTLNREYLRRDKPTNVLAFSMREGEFSTLHPHLLGDLVISVETAKRPIEPFRSRR